MCVLRYYRPNKKMKLKILKTYLLKISLIAIWWRPQINDSIELIWSVTSVKNFNQKKNWIKVWPFGWCVFIKKILINRINRIYRNGFNKIELFRDNQKYWKMNLAGAHNSERPDNPVEEASFLSKCSFW